MKDEIRVTVVKYPDRRALMMRYADPKTGKHTARSTGTTNRREAERAAAKWEAELRECRYKPPSKKTWEEFKGQYFDANQTLAPSTVDKIDSLFSAIERLMKPKRAADLTTESLSEFVADLRVEEIKEGKRVRIGRSETTIAGYLRHLKPILKWGKKHGFLSAVPDVDRVKGSTVGKGRAINLEEFERMLAMVPKALAYRDFDRNVIEAPPAEVDRWRFYLRGLWLSGFRLSESIELSWDDPSKPMVDLTGRRAVVRFPEGSQKSRKAEVWACPPDFTEMLQSVPKRQRRGRVYKLTTITRDLPVCDARAMKILGKIGEKAGIVVNRSSDGASVKYASAHDLRRSFCTRWSKLVMPQVLMRMARHASITTTMAYYVTQTAEETADVMFQAIERQRRDESNSSGNNRRNSRSKSSQKRDVNRSDERN